MRAYELMIICDGDLEESAVQGEINQIEAQVQGNGGQIASTDKWGKRRFAYPIDHKDEGWYVVFEIVGQPDSLEGLDRNLRLADEVVRHKLIRLPDTEAARRGLLGEASPANAG
jgi:small subunit ribosomal protein S6